MSARVKCKVCRKSVPSDRSQLGLKTCSRRCTEKLKRWRSPRYRTIAKVLPTTTGEILWNDERLRERLGGVTREEASARLAALAQSRGLVACPDERYPGGVLFVAARVNVEQPGSAWRASIDHSRQR